MSASAFLLYGSYGYTGALIAAEAVRRGLRPILAGRNAARLQAQAATLDLPYRVLSLEDPRALDAALREVPLVLHCAGPYAVTARPMAAACLRTGTHYLDITGEIGVFEYLARLDEEAQAAGVMLLPGAGFDVVPSDCLAAHLKQRLPTATHLELAFMGLGAGMSHGTASTMLYNLTGQGVVRREGRLTPVPLGTPSRLVDFGRGPRRVYAIPWGDVSTAFYSTGIPNITVYTRLPDNVARWLPLARRLLPLVRRTPLRRWLQRRIDAAPPGPTAEQRARGRSLLWGEVRDDAGQHASARLVTPEGYTLTVLTALALVERVLQGQAPPGFQTPAKAFGPDFILTIPGVQREPG